MILNRTLIRSPVSYALCTNEKQLHNLLKKINVAPQDYCNFVSEGYGAEVHYYESEEDRYAIVCMNIYKDDSIADTVALLAHEASHIFDYITEYMNEAEPSKEFKAWSLQTIVSNLVEEYYKQVRIKK